MSERSPEQHVENFFRLCELMDFYVITQARAVRRVSVPAYLKPTCVFACTPFNRIDDDHFDKVGRKWADKRGCTYAEAIFEYLVSIPENDSLGEQLLALLEDRDTYEKQLESFTREQKRREQEWRKARDDWREPLPPALTDADF